MYVSTYFSTFCCSISFLHVQRGHFSKRSLCFNPESVSTIRNLFFISFFALPVQERRQPQRHLLLLHRMHWQVRHGCRKLRSWVGITILPYTVKFTLLSRKIFFSSSLSFGVCCVFVLQTGSTSIGENCTYIQNMGYPSALEGTAPVSYTVNKLSNG